jgi:phage shock protein A
MEKIMASSFWKSIRNLFRSKRDEAAKAISNPVVDGHYDIIDAKKQIGEYESRVTKFVASNKQLNSKIETKEAEIKKWGEIAVRAAAQGNEVDVRKAVSTKQSLEKVAAALRDEYAKNSVHVDKLRDQLTNARERIERAEHNKVQLEARHEGAKIRKELAEASSAFSLNTGPLASLDDLEKAVLEQEAIADATEEMNGLSSDDLGNKYALDSSNVDDEVNELLGRIK